MKTIKFVVADAVGLHARPATVLVTSISNSLSNVEIKYQDKKVNLKSIMSILSLAVPGEAEVEIFVEGEDEKETTKQLLTTLKETGIAKL